MESEPAIRASIKNNVKTNEIFKISTYNNDISVIIYEKNGYYNATKICNDNNKKLKNLIRNVSWKRFLEAYLKCEPAQNISDIIIELDEGYLNELKGTYIHPSLINYVCEWCNYEYAVKVSKIMRTINEELHIKNITLDQKINELEENLKNLNEELASTKKYISNLNTTIKRREGSLKISKFIKNNKTYYSVIPSQLIQPKRFERETIINQYNPNETLRLLSFYVTNNCLDKVRSYDKRTTWFECENINVLLQAINDISKNTININIDYNNIIKNTIYKWKKNCELFVKDEFILKDYIFKKQRNQGTIFELFCARKYNIPPFKYQRTEGMGLNKKDIGCDLLNIETSTCAQCKFYNSDSRLSQNNIETFINFIDAMELEYNFLFVNESLEYSPNLDIPCNIDIIKVPDSEIYEFIDEICEIYKTWEQEELDLKNKLLKEKNEKNERLLQEIDENKTQIRIEIDNHLADKYEKNKYKNKSENSNRVHVNQDIKEFVRSYIYDGNLEGISLNDMIEKIKNEYNINYNIYSFGKSFSDLYKHELNDGYPLNNGVKWLYPILNSNLDEEIDFIYFTINHGEYLTKEYLDIHNRQFHTNYNIKSFSHQFGKLFKHVSDCLARRTIDSKRVHVFVLIDNNNENVYIDWINKIIKEHNLITYIVSKFNEYFHCYYTNFMFIQTFKRFFKIENKAIRAPIDEINKYKNLYNIDIETTPTRIYSL